MSHRSHVLLAALIAFTALASAQERGPNGRAQNPGLTGWCETPVADRKSDLGCYTTASTPLGKLSRVPVYWHLDTFRDQASAEANRSARGTVVQSHGKHWLFTIAEEAWRPKAGGERVAIIGPLGVDADVAYTARYLEATIAPGFQDGGNGHRHPGPEAWYVISGGQCLETPNGVMVGRAGDTMLAPEGWPMAISSMGADTRRTVFLVLHRSDKPYSMAVDVTPDSPHSHWKPRGACPK